MYGGFENLNYDPDSTYASALAPNGLARWSVLKADDLVSTNGHAKTTLNVGFPGIDWTSLRSIYGWAALQYQAWARGNLTVQSNAAVTVAISIPGLLEIWIDKRPYFGGDFYSFRKAPLFLTLEPGTHVLEVRLVRDVRALGGSDEPLVSGIIEVNQITQQLMVDTEKILTAEVVNGRIASPFASINIHNPMSARAEVVSIENTGVS